MRTFINNPKILLLLCLTLGLAPFVPEPHIWGKLRWVIGGTQGMQVMDYLDLLFHSLPWILLIRWAIVKGIKAKR